MTGREKVGVMLPELVCSQAAPALFPLPGQNRRNPPVHLSLFILSVSARQSCLQTSMAWQHGD